jgi:hypothetical protein
VRTPGLELVLVYKIHGDPLGLQVVRRCDRKTLPSICAYLISANEVSLHSNLDHRGFPGFPFRWRISKRIGLF